jgi:hypothetical protein
MRISVVLNFDVPTPEKAAEVLLAIDPPKLPYFVDESHVVPEPFSIELAAWLSSTEPDPLDRNLARLEALVRDFDHYANHGDPNHGADTFFRTLHGHLVSTFLLASGKAQLAEVVDELESHDRAIAGDAIAAGLTSAVGTHRAGSAFGL